MEDQDTFDTASDFLTVMRRSHHRWLDPGDWSSFWIFRGQGSENFRLTPKAWRESAKSHSLYRQLGDVSPEAVRQQLVTLPPGVREGATEARVAEALKQRVFEDTAIRVFAQSIDDLGIRVPGGASRWHRPSIPRLVFHELIDHDSTFRFAGALAQHHGIPTRYLDWTRNPAKAAFFAADAAEQGSGKVVVWALNLRALGNRGPNVLTVDRSEIGFLHAQEGLFTYFAGADLDYVLNGQWPQIEEILPPQALIKLTLPSSATTELKRLLWADGISRAHLMPTHDNVTRALEAVWTDSERLAQIRTRRPTDPVDDLLMPYGLYTDETLLALPDLAGITAEQLQRARDSGAIKVETVPGKGQLMRGAEVQKWLDAKKAAP
jgi:hypothetical protein